MRGWPTQCAACGTGMESSPAEPLTAGTTARRAALSASLIRRVGTAWTTAMDRTDSAGPSRVGRGEAEDDDWFLTHAERDALKRRAVAVPPVCRTCAERAVVEWATGVKMCLD